MWAAMVEHGRAERGWEFVNWRENWRELAGDTTEVRAQADAMADRCIKSKYKDCAYE